MSELKIEIYTTAEEEYGVTLLDEQVDEIYELMNGDNLDNDYSHSEVQAFIEGYLEEI